MPFFLISLNKQRKPLIILLELLFSIYCIFKYFHQQQKLMKKQISFLQAVFKKFDLFPATQFLRYKQEAEYKTATGGFVSVAIITIFIILFYNLGTQTINRQIINGTVTYNIEVQPEPLKINFTDKSDFMFSVGVVGLNLSDPSVRYFNVSLIQHSYSRVDQSYKGTNIPLVQCTPQHFSYDEDIAKFYYQFNLSATLCPPLNQEFIVGGRITSSIFQTFSVYVSNCNKTIDQKCLSSIQMEYLQSYLGGFMLIVPTISSIVNPGDSDYRQVYIEDRNHFYFTTQLGVQITGQVQMYQVQTDTSLMPYTQIITQYITTIPNLFEAKPKVAFDNIYAQVKFTKSNVSTVFTRSFNKLDNYFSYVGGLVGTILLFFYLLSNYSQKSYAIDIASELFTLQQDSSSNPKEFNFVYYIAMFIQKILVCFHVELDWEWSSKFTQAAEEMQKQLNISHLLKRISYFEDAVTSILTEYQAQTLHLTAKKTIADAANWRKYSNYSKDILQLKFNVQIPTDLSGGQKLNHNNLQLDYFCKNSPSALQKQVKQTNLEAIDHQNKSQVLEVIQKSNLIEKIKESLVQVIRESNEGNQISHRIMIKVSKIISEMGFSLQNQHTQKDQTNEKFAVSNLHKQKGNNKAGNIYNLQFSEIE